MALVVEVEAEVVPLWDTSDETDASAYRLGARAIIQYGLKFWDSGFLGE